MDAQVTEEWRQMEEAEEILWHAQSGKGVGKCDSGLAVKQLK